MNVFVDGSNRGNPGVGGIGVVVYDNSGKLIKAVQKFVGDNITNNQAEYLAVIEALILLIKINKNKEYCTIHTDSKVVCNQINGFYKINLPHLEFLKQEIEDLLQLAGFCVTINNVERENNVLASDLAQSITKKYKRTLLMGQRSWKGFK